MGDLVVRVGRSLRSLGKEGIAALVALLVTVNYAALYFAYFQFYVSFGLSPGDVGHTRTKLLQESTLGMVARLFWASQWRADVVAASLAGTAIVAFVLRRRAGDGARPRREDVAGTLLVGVVVACAVLLASAYAEAARTARALGNEVRRHGHIVIATVRRPAPADGDGKDPLYLPMLDMRAVPVAVVPKKDTALPALTDGCLLLLGQADDQVVLFDYSRRAVVRIPAGDVSVVTYPALRDFPGERLPVSCKQ
ncbi:MAG TPA: hypothetical protein VNA20_03265 [Frankiaceae bacterium]|nr:hypothetical protein [Frankiaceae bacterium]